MSATIQTIKAKITNVHLIGGTIMIDAGYSGTMGVIQNGLRAVSIDPGKIALIVLTHTHWDHIGSLPEIAKLTGAKVLVHAAEDERLAEGSKCVPPGITPWGRFLSKFLLPLMPPVAPVQYRSDVVMEDEYPLYDYGIDGRIIHTPGHSPGSVSVILDDGNAFVGDMAMNGFPLRLSPGTPIFAEVPERILSSWERIRSSGAQKIHPAHGRSFPVDALKEQAATSF